MHWLAVAGTYVSVLCYLRNGILLLQILIDFYLFGNHSSKWLRMSSILLVKVLKKKVTISFSRIDDGLTRLLSLVCVGTKRIVRITQVEKGVTYVFIGILITVGFHEIRILLFGLQSKN